MYTYIIEQPGQMLAIAALGNVPLRVHLGSIPEWVLNASHTDRTKGNTREDMVVLQA